MNLSIDEALLQAKKHVKNGAFVEAMNLFMAVDQQSPGNKFVRKSINKLQKKLGSDYQPLTSEILNRLIAMGNNGQARAAIDEALALTNQHPRIDKLWNVIGFLYANAHDYPAAISAYQTCISLNDTNPEVHKNLGLAYRQNNQIENAIISFQRSAELYPEGFDAVVSLAQIHKQRGQYETSLIYYEKIAAHHPDRLDALAEYAQLLTAMGLHERSEQVLKTALLQNDDKDKVKFAMVASYREAGKWEEAVTICEELVERHPQSNTYLQYLGDLYANLDRLDDSEACFRSALNVAPTDLTGLNNMGVVLGKQKKFDDALVYFRKALDIDPGHVDSLFNMGNAYSNMSNTEQAIDCFSRAVLFDPKRRDAHTNLGSEYRRLGETHKAYDCFDAATKIDPDFACGYYSMGTVCRELGDRQKARELYHKALSLEPDEPDALTNLGMLEVLEGEFEAGWRHYEHRWRVKDQKGNPPFASHKSQWDGEAKLRVLFWPEQGVGDQIMYCSVLPDLAERCEEVSVIIDRRLVDLMKRSFGDIPNLKIYSQDEKLSHDIYDQHLSFGSSFMYLRPDFDSFKAMADGYLAVDPERMVSISKTLGSAARKRRVGISWHTVNKQVGHQRRMSLENLVSCFDPEKTELINLQYGDVDDEIAAVAEKTGITVRQVDDVDITQDFEGMAALTCLLDEVVSIDNSTVHLAGALGQRVNILVPLDPDWRWGVNTDKSYLYSKARLIRQSGFRDWGNVLDELKQHFG